MQTNTMYFKKNIVLGIAKYYTKDISLYYYDS